MQCSLSLTIPHISPSYTPGWGERAPQNPCCFFTTPPMPDSSWLSAPFSSVEPSTWLLSCSQYPLCAVLHPAVWTPSHTGQRSVGHMSHGVLLVWCVFVCFYKHVVQGFTKLLLSLNYAARFGKHRDRHGKDNREAMAQRETGKW